MKQEKTVLKIIITTIIIIFMLTIKSCAATVTSNVTFVTNDGIFSSNPISTYTQGTEISLPTNIRKRGYDFAGWYTTATFTGSAVTQIPSTSTGNVTYYAKWKLNPQKNAYEKISGGMYHNLAIDSHGNLIAWGINNNGQLGDGTQTNRTIPTQIMDGTTFKEISAGGLFSLAIDSNGGLWASGSNGIGQLGDGTTVSKSTPVKITNTDGTTFTSISAGIAHSLAIDSNGKMWAWGLNSDGQLGNGTTTNSTKPIKIMSGTSFKAVAAGSNYSLAIDVNGNLYAWGANANGQLGNGSTTTLKSPTQIASGTTFKNVEASRGEKYSLALDTNGNLYTWGTNKYGQLGNGTFTDKNIPTQIELGKEYKEINAGYNTSFAISADGTLYAWGANGNGELTNGTQVLTASPIEVLNNVKAVAATWNHTVFINENGATLGCGANEEGEVGIGTITQTPILTPTIIAKRDDSEYKVEHYKQNVSLNGYELADTDNLMGPTDSNITATAKSYSGFTENKTINLRVPNGVVTEDGSLVLKLYYDRSSYSIQLETNEGIINSGNVTSYKYGIGATLPTDITKTGYTFGGWYIGNGLIGDKITSVSTTDTGNKKFYAFWSINKYAVTFKNDGQIVNSETVDYLTDATPPELTKPGYTLSWDGSYRTVTENRILNAVWTANTNTAYKVEHYKQNTTFDGYNLANTDNLTGTTATDVTATAKNYAGFTENTTTDLRITSGTISGDGSLVLKLYYDRNTYNVTLHANDGTINSGNITSYIYGVGATLPTDVTKIGYTFVGWYDNESLNGNNIEKITTTDVGNKEYFANWTENEDTPYTVVHQKMNLDGTTYEVVDTENLQGRTGASVTPSVKQYEGFTSPNTQTTTIAADGSTIITYNYARNKYTFTLESCIGVETTGSTPSGEYLYETPINLKAVVKSGYTWSKWTNKVDMTEILETEKTITMPANNITYMPVVTIDTYNIVYILNDGIVEIENPTTYTVETESFTLNNPTKTGYTFAGWTGSNGTTMQTNVSVAKGSTGNKEYIANWNINKYAVTFKDGENIKKSETVDYLTDATPPELTKPGYTLSWDGDYRAVTENRIVNAIWKANENTLYKVEHYKQNLTLDGYELVYTDNLTGTTDTNIDAVAKDYTGFTENTETNLRVPSGIILGDGSLVLKLYYDRNEYNITLHANEGTINSGEVTSYIYGIGATLPTDVTRPGYTFEGWNDSEVLNEDYVEEVTTTDYGDKEYFAVWTANKNTPYIVEHYKQNLTLDGYELVDTDNLTGTTDTSVDAVAKEYVGFTENTETNLRVPSGIILGDGSLVLKLYYDRNEYNITLHPNEGTINSGEVTSYIYGIGAVLPTDVTRVGYTFAGWNDSKLLDGNTIERVTTTDVGDKEYFAKWIANENTPYRVEHYKQNLSLDGYELVDIDNLTGTTDTTVDAVAKEYVGFTENTETNLRIPSGIISGDGSLVLKLYYDRNEYNITLHANEGTINSGDVTSYIYGIGATLPTDVTRPGYTFEGWNDSEVLNGDYVEEVTTTDYGDKEYFAVWIANEDTPYTVEHYKQNLTLDGYELVYTDNLTGRTDTTIDAVAKDYVGFTENTETNLRVPSGVISGDGSLVLKLYYNRNTYNITLHPNEGTINSGEVTSYIYGIGAILPTDVTRIGYTFAGWNDSELLNGKIIEEVTTTDVGDKEYFAVWTANTNTPYTVEHYKQNLTLDGYELVDTDNLTGTTDTNINAVAKDYVGFTENTETNLRVPSGVISGDGSLVLKLYYDRNIYNIELETNEGTINSGNVTSYIYGIGATLPTDVTKPGYTFEGWYDSELLNGSSIEKITTADVGDKEYFAKWTANDDTPYIVEHYKQNLSLDGYELVDTDNLIGTTGTNIEAIAKEYIGFTENTETNLRIPSGIILGDGSLVLKLYYDRNIYNIELETNEGTINSGNVTSYVYGIGAILPTDVTKIGYTFNGWYVKNAENEFVGDKVTKVSDTDTGDKKFYAYWIINKYVVTFKDGENIKKSETVEYLSDATPPELTKPGYTLSWDGDYRAVTEDRIINAVWTANEDTSYIVEHYKQNLTLDGYELVDTDNLTGTTDTTIDAVAKDYVGFTENTETNLRVPSGIILGDGSLVLKLYYDRNIYNIELETNKGTINSGNVTSYIYGIGAVLPTDVTRPGYTFAGWNDSKLLDGNTIERVTTTDIGDKEYFAKWIANEDTPYTVEHYKENLNLDGYELADTDNLIGTTDTNAIAIPKNYIGFTENTETNLRIPSGIISGDGSLVLKLYYYRNSYAIRFETNEGTINSGNITSYVYAAETILPTDVTKPGYTFAGWYDNESLNGNVVEKITSTDIGNKKYYAKWIEKNDISYKTEYYLRTTDPEVEGYILYETENLTGRIDSTVEIEKKEFEGFTADIENTNNILKGLVSKDGSLVLKLYYDRNLYNITYNINGGKATGTLINKYMYGKETNLSEKVEKAGYVFAGWYDNAEFIGTTIKKIGNTETGDKTLYAKWSYASQYYIVSDTHEIDLQNRTIAEIKNSTNVSTFIKNLKTNGTVRILNSKGNVLTDSSLVGTGSIVEVTYKGTKYKYSTIVKGDLDGNGRISVTDLAIMNQAIVGRTTLSGVYSKAADLDGNGRMSVTDLAMMNQVIVGRITL